MKFYEVTTRNGDTEQVVGKFTNKREALDCFYSHVELGYCSDIHTVETQQDNRTYTPYKTSRMGVNYGRNETNSI